jgi:hypothetical protein
MKCLRTILFGTCVAFGAPCLAQTPAQRLAELARAQIDGLTFDSARVLLDATLRAATTPAEKIRAFTLLAFVQLGLKNQIAARQAFEQALRLDPTMRIDSLADLDADAPNVFASARTAAATVLMAAPEKRVVLLLTVLLPADTLVSADDARLPMIVQPNAVSRVITTVAVAAAPSVPVWSDTQTTLGRHRIAWLLRRRDGSVWPVGRYMLRSEATDSMGQTTSEMRVVNLARTAVDTQSHPPTLPASVFAPEALPSVRHTTPRLVAGSALALAVAAMPSVLGSPDLNAGLSSDPTSYAVAGSVAVASIVGFVRGRRPQPLKANILKNRALRENDQRQRDAIKRANADSLDKAPIRITVDRAP